MTLIMMNIHFISLGCPKNLVDSEVMLGLLSERGYAFTEEAEAAEVIVINTCAFIEDAKREAIDTILTMARMKDEGKCRLLVVAGCLPQRYRDELATLLPEVDAFVGAGEFHRIAEIIEGGDGRQRLHVGRPEYLYDHTTPRVHATPAHVGYIKIAEGCFHPCSFCIIPKLRGRFRSRAPESIVAEARAMIDRGVRELNLIGQDLTAFGRDNDTGLAPLLRDLSGLAGQKWIRLLYAYPHAFPDAVIEAMRDGPDICRYLDIPIQHISDALLKAMRRGGDGDEIRRLIERLRSRISGIGLRTSLIVGFPGETDADFDELERFVVETRFEHLGVFTYSPEEGTHAATLPNAVPPDLAHERRDRLMELQQEIAQAHNDALVGKRLRVLVEGPSEETELLWQARHEGQAPDIDGVVYINEGDAAPGSFAEVEITEAHAYDLVAKIVKREA